MTPAKAAFLAAWVLSGAVVGVIVVPDRVVWAANAEAEGRKHARKANHLADINKCKLAIPEYSKALRLLKDPTLLFNRGECYRRTGDSARAVADYRQFLAQLPGAPNRAQVENQIAALDKRPAAPALAKAPAKSPAARTGVPKSPPSPPGPAVPFSYAELHAAEEEGDGAAASGPPPAPGPAPEAPMALVDVGARSTPAAQAEQGSPSHWWIWVIAAAVVAGGAAGTYFALKQGKTDIPASGLGNYKF